MPSTIPTYKTHDISAARNPRHLQAKHNVLSLPKIQSNEAPQTHYQAKERTCPTFIPSHGWNTCGLLWSAVDYIHHNLNQSETSQNGCTHTHTHTHTQRLRSVLNLPKIYIVIRVITGCWSIQQTSGLPCYIYSPIAAALVV